MDALWVQEIEAADTELELGELEYVVSGFHDADDLGQIFMDGHDLLIVLLLPGIYIRFRLTLIAYNLSVRGCEGMDVYVSQETI